MPVFIDRHFTCQQPVAAQSLAKKPPANVYDDATGYIRLGLINNMGDEALKATERQFLSLLDAASDGMLVHLSLYTLPGVIRTASIEHHVRELYCNMDDLWDGHLDGLIVTGREPLQANLIDEPYWDSFTTLLEWAQENTHSTVWSCLAAHAAILHMDGISRVKRSSKLSGVFECARVNDHALTARTPFRFKLPHSRWNGLPEELLTLYGYSVLTRAGDAGVDTFIKHRKSLFVFFQSHPEYESDTLLREYRRDVGRYFKGEVSAYPELPWNYFDEETADGLSELQRMAAGGGGPELMLEISRVLAESKIANTWQLGAAGIYRNWLKYISAKKEQELRPKRARVVAALEPVS